MVYLILMHNAYLLPSPCIPVWCENIDKTRASWPASSPQTRQRTAGVCANTLSLQFLLAGIWNCLVN